MRKILNILAALFLLAIPCAAGDAVSWTISVGTTDNGVAYADPFTGSIDEMAVYTTAGVSGAVSIVALDPYSSTALVLATNAAVEGYAVWTPRIAAAGVSGSSARSVTNALTADRYNAQGESFYATVTGSSATGVTWRVRIKMK